MIRIYTVDGKLTHVGKSYRIMGEGNYHALYLWSSPEGVRLYEGSTYDGREIPLTSLVDEIVRRKGAEIFNENVEKGKEYGEGKWNELKEKLEKEYHFCPFCDFPKDVEDAKWKLIPSIEKLREHIAQYHLRVSSDISIMDNKKVEYRSVKLSEEMRA